MVERIADMLLQILLKISQVFTSRVSRKVMLSSAFDVIEPYRHAC